MIKLTASLILLTLMASSLSGDYICGKKYNPVANQTCSEIFDIFHKCTGRFLERSLDTANPFTLCTDAKAHDYYRNLTKYLNLLDQTTDPRYNVKCTDEYLYKNRMSVISHIVDMSVGIWNKANCDDCYANDKTFSQHTIAFHNTYSDYRNCVTKHGPFPTSICKNCVDLYMSLNQLFDGEKIKREGKICFDLEDSMNKTRQEWSVDYKCCRDKNDSLKAFYGLFSTIMILAVVFYASVYITGSKFEDLPVIDASDVSQNASISSTSSESFSNLRTSPQAES